MSLVKLDFLSLVTYADGSIAPVAGENAEDVGPVPFKPATLAEECKSMQQKMLQVNEAFRAKRNLPHRYERGHFAVEGRVMYLLDEKGRLLNRTMYKYVIQPSTRQYAHTSAECFFFN